MPSNILYRSLFTHKPSRSLLDCTRSLQGEETLMLNKHEYSGMQSIHYDTWRNTSGHTLMHAGHIQYLHRDPNGYAQYVLVRSGCNIYGLAVPKIKGATHPHLSDAINHLKAGSMHKYDFDFRTHFDLYTLFLCEGDVM